MRKVKELENTTSATASSENYPQIRSWFYNAVSGFAHPSMWIIPQEKTNNFIPVKWGLIPLYKLGADAEAYYKETIRYGSRLNAKSEKLFVSKPYIKQ